MKISLSNNKLFTILIICLPFFQQYASIISGVSLGEFLLLPFFLLIIVFVLPKDMSILLKNELFLLLIWSLFSTLLSAFFQPHVSIISAIITLSRVFFYYCLAFLGGKNLFDWKLGFKFYKIMVSIFTIYLFFQVFFRSAFGVALPWYISFLPLNVKGDYTGIDFTMFFNDFYRPYSLFLEPGYYAQYAIPCLVISLFNKKYLSFWFSIFISVGLLLSTSGQGILIASFIWVVFVFNQLITLKKEKIAYFLILTIPVTLVLINIMNKEFFQRSIGRLFTPGTGSAELRIYQGFTIFGSLTFIEKLIGIGFNNIQEYITSSALYGITTPYMNSLSFILMSTGVLGGLILTKFFIKTFFKVNLQSKVLLLCFGILCMVSGILTSATSVLYLLFSQKLKNEDHIYEE
ncbi:hypothetical protein [Vagococcus fluvialis]|uniref:hypothetical protein n=1 Tax=Vagococcus fluvialis TaxID=2738 RepID=UPI003B5B7D6D